MKAEAWGNDEWQDSANDSDLVAHSMSSPIPALFQSVVSTGKLYGGTGF